MIDLIKHKALILALSMTVLAGCSSTGGPEEGYGTGAQPVDQDGGSEVYDGREDGGISSSELAEQQRAAEQAEQELAALRNVRTIYFDFDSSEIRAESRDVLVAHARYLSENPAVDVVLRGHTDERGTTEYNLALGERRAQAVESFLSINGVDPSRIETVSYGEERPAVSGSGEEAYAKNRRVEIEYE